VGAQSALGALSFRLGPALLVAPHLSLGLQLLLLLLLGLGALLVAPLRLLLVQQLRHRVHHLVQLVQLLHLVLAARLLVALAGRLLQARRRS